MLVQLHIENYALIDRMVVDFGPGLNVLTGETGAGKSMIVGALGLILGQRAHTEMVRADDKPTVVEALFDLSVHPQLLELLSSLGIETNDPYLLLKRLVTRNSSRCYINANLATLTMLQEIGQHLVDLLSQHQHQTLLRHEQQLALLDAYGKLADDSAALRLAYQRYQELTKDLQTLQHAAQHRDQRLDLLRFQAEEINKAQLHSDEEEQLAAEHHLLLNAEKLYELSQDAYALLYRNEHALLRRWQRSATRSSNSPPSIRASTHSRQRYKRAIMCWRKLPNACVIIATVWRWTRPACKPSLTVWPTSAVSNVSMALPCRHSALSPANQPRAPGIDTARGTSRRHPCRAREATPVAEVSGSDALR